MPDVDVRTTPAVVTHWEGADLVVMARIKGLDALYINQVSISTVAVKVFDMKDPDRAQIGATYSPSVASTVFDTLQTDARWTKDRTGYNFRVTVAGAYFPAGDRPYRVEIVFTPVSGAPFPLVVSVNARALLG